MSRAQKTIRIGGNDRDTGKVFVITEMSPRDGHRWAGRAMLALLNSGFEIPDDLAASGLAGLAAMGMTALGKADRGQIEPLLDELLTCVVVVPDPDKPNVTRRDFERDVEEIKTFFTLQVETLKLHLEPFMRGVQSNGALTPATPLAD